MLQLTLDFHAPKDIDLPCLDRWLVDVLEIDEIIILNMKESNAPEDVIRARRFLLRSLFLSKVLLQVGRLPVFDLPRIVEIEPVQTGKDKYRGRVELPIIEQIPINCYPLAIKSSFGLCRWAGLNALTDENLRKFYNAIQQNVIRPLHRMVSAGKSTIPVLRVAHSLEIPFIHLGQGVYQLGWGSKARRMDRSTTEQDSAIGSKLSQNKVAAASLLRMAGLPAPVHAVVGIEADAISAAGKIGFPVVIKPADRDRGEGVTVDVSDESCLRPAFENAQKVARNKQVIVERQVPGVCHRLFIANGRLLYAVKRLPMSIKGDGEHSIAELVEIEFKTQQRKPPWSRTEIRPIDDLAINAMRREGHTPESVAAAGSLVPLRRIESTEWGGVDEDVSGQIHPENLSVAIRAAKLFGLHVAGIDIITPDIGIPWFENGAIVNEVNFAPLFGGGEISKRHIPIFLKEFIQGDGKIPIETFGDDDASIAAAYNRRDELIKQGLRCYFTTHSKTIDPTGKELKLSFNRVDKRVRALICSFDVDAIVIASETKGGDVP